MMCAYTRIKDILGEYNNILHHLMSARLHTNRTANYLLPSISTETTCSTYNMQGLAPGIDARFLVHRDPRSADSYAIGTQLQVIHYAKGTPSHHLKKDNFGGTRLQMHTITR